MTTGAAPHWRLPEFLSEKKAVIVVFPIPKVESFSTGTGGFQFERVGCYVKGIIVRVMTFQSLLMLK